MKPESVPAGMRYISVALLFALCGAWSAAMFLPLQHFPIGIVGPNDLYRVFPLPFAFLCTLLFMRTVRAFLIVPLMVAAWWASILVAGRMWLPWAIGYDNPFGPACVGGMVGGLGVTLTAAIGKPRLLSPKYLVTSCALGAVSAVPLALWLRLSREPHALMWSFALWQAAMGTYLSAIWIAVSRKAHRGCATEGDR